MVIVRTDKPKEYGTAKQIEGALAAGERVLLIEDVVTTGGAALSAVDELRAAGAEVVGALVVVDREQGGQQRSPRAACRFARCSRGPSWAFRRPGAEVGALRRV